MNIFGMFLYILTLVLTFKGVNIMLGFLDKKLRKAEAKVRKKFDPRPEILDGLLKAAASIRGNYKLHWGYCVAAATVFNSMEEPEEFVSRMDEMWERNKELKKRFFWKMTLCVTGCLIGWTALVVLLTLIIL